MEGYPTINSTGQVAFIASMTAPDNTVTSGIVRGDGTARIMVAREKQAVPAGTGIFSNISGREFTMNDSGQLAFIAGLDIDLTNVAPVEEVGVFFYDQTLGLLKVVRQNDALLGSTISSLRFAGNLTANGGVVPVSRRGLNNAGQVAYGFTLKDGREGIAIWSLNPPARLANGTITRTAQGYLVQFPGTSGQRYIIQRSDTLVRPWTNLAAPLTANSAGIYQAEDDPGATVTRRFYRGTVAP